MIPLTSPRRVSLLRPLFPPTNRRFSPSLLTRHLSVPLSRLSLWLSNCSLCVSEYTPTIAIPKLRSVIDATLIRRPSLIVVLSLLCMSFHFLMLYLPFLVSLCTYNLLSSLHRCLRSTLSSPTRPLLPSFSVHFLSLHILLATVETIPLVASHPLPFGRPTVSYLCFGFCTG